MRKREDTPARLARRRYEEKIKDKRKALSGNFGTMIPRPLFEEINAFLKENKITKVRLIREGFKVLQKKKNDGTLHTDFQED